MSCEFVSCEVCLLLNSREERDFYVAKCCAADMSRKAFAEHLRKSFPSQKELYDKMLLSWYKVTGEGCTKPRWRPPKQQKGLKALYYRLLNSQEARKAYVQSLGGMTREEFVVHLSYFFPSPHHKVLREKMVCSWCAAREMRLW